jgi:hypothetical protein
MVASFLDGVVRMSACRRDVNQKTSKEKKKGRREGKGKRKGMKKHSLARESGWGGVGLCTGKTNNLIRNVSLDSDVVETLRVLGDRRAGCELLGKAFRGFLEVDA